MSRRAHDPYAPHVTEDSAPRTPRPARLRLTEVPDGTAADVVEWVGEDRARAAVALIAERRRERPRSTLVKTLERLVD